jgi:hypothetical protein
MGIFFLTNLTIMIDLTINQIRHLIKLASDLVNKITHLVKLANALVNKNTYYIQSMGLIK